MNFFFIFKIFQVRSKRDFVWFDDVKVANELNSTIMMRTQSLSLESFES